MKQIHSRDNPLVRNLRRLAESARERKKSGQTLLDGLNLIQAYESVQGPVHTLVVSEDGLQDAEISTFLVGRDAVLLAPGLFRSLSAVESPSGILGLAAIPAPDLVADPAADCVLLDGIQDPGNLGTLLRTTAAAGIGQVLLSRECVAAWSPKVLRAGQGAHFVLAIHEGIELAAFLNGFRGTGAVTTLETAQSLYTAPLTPPLAWVFGSEGRGVSAPVAAAATLRIRIPMPGPIESLNVAAAAAICLFEALRRRSA